MNWKDEARVLIAKLVERMNDLDSLVLDLQSKLDGNDEVGFFLIAEDIVED